MAGAIDSLPWLLPPPADFRAGLKAVAAAPDAKAIRRLAGFALELDQLERLSRLISGQRPLLLADGLLGFKLGIAGSHTLDHVAQSVVATGLRYGLLIELLRADYGQLAQSVLDPGSRLATSALDAVLLCLDARMLGLADFQPDQESAIAAVDEAIAQVRMLRNGVRDVIGTTCVLQTLPAYPDSLFGNLDLRVAGTQRAMIAAFNQRLALEVVESGDLLIDVAAVAANFGLARWHDTRSWHSAKLPFAIDAAPLYAEHVCRVLGAAKGKSRKCLVLDLDNTLWGGVIGDDGLEGIKLGQGNSAGEAYLAIQALALELRQRGVILAVCSKNEDSNARLPFREHGDMLLREQHIAAFVANWTDKATNLREIAAILNIGTDALVFLDDNPAERAIVRQELPEVAVPEAGDDPSLYPAMIAQAGYFEAVGFSAEDRQRAEYYQANSERRTAQTAITNMEDYLASLEMVMTAIPFDAMGRARTAQLVNKSNQFNLTTKRYSEADVAAIGDDPEKYTLQVRLADKFGDNGMISVIVFDKAADVWSCDTWLMSCRVLGRRVEHAVLSLVAAAAQAAGATRLRGRYIPTAKNDLVREHFAKLGFTLVGTGADGATDWELAIADLKLPPLPIDIRTD